MTAPTRSDSKRIDYTNRQIGHLIVLEYSHYDRRGAYWRCRCICGKELILPANHLKTKTSCGCRPNFHTRPTIPPLDNITLRRFLSHVEVTDTCHNWTGTKDQDGYGITYIQGRNYKAHRVAYNHFVAPVPQGTVVCHQCDNPGCINPQHLFVGTAHENLLDMVSKGRSKKGIPKPRSQVEKSIDATCKVPRSDYTRIALSKKTEPELAKEYGVSVSTIARIKGRRRREIYAKEG